MSGPAVNFGSAISQAIDAQIEDEDPWRKLIEDMLPAKVSQQFRPADEVLLEIGRYSQTEAGRRLFAWLHELTDRAPYPVISGGLEETAMAASRHMGRAGVGKVIGHAEALGRQMFEAELKRGST